MTTHAFFDPLGAFAADAPAKGRAAAKARSLCHRALRWVARLRRLVRGAEERV